MSALFALAALLIGTGSGTGGVPAPLLSKLTRGVNVTRWFCYLRDAGDTTHFASYFLDDDVANLKRLDVKFVRLCVSPQAIYKDGEISEATLPFLDRAISRLEQAGLAVLIDLHDNGQMKLDQPGQDNSGLVRFWARMAAHYRGKQLNSTIFEIVNEPVFTNNASTWWALQNETVKAIRAVDPKRTILVSGTGYGGIDGLSKMPILAEKNLVYSYHCYDPFIFTHQGATWTGDQQKAMRGIPFPSSPEAVAKMIDKIPSRYQDSVRQYGEQRLGENYLRDQIGKAVAWGALHKVPTLLGEFGSYPPVAPVEARSYWFRAMASVIKEFRVPNSIWGYDDGMGLGRRVDGGRVILDPIALQNFFGVAAK